MNRLILLEGLPGTGKTTNSYRLFEQLVRNGRDVRWLHEVSQPHPVLFFSIPQWSETGTVYTKITKQSGE